MYKANSRARDKPRPSGFRMLGTGSLALGRKGNAMVGVLNVNGLVGMLMLWWGILGQKWEGGNRYSGYVDDNGEKCENLCGHTRGWL